MPGSRVVRALLAWLAVLGIAVACASPAIAHGGAPSVEVSPSSIAPGGSTTVNGDDLSPGVSGVLHLLTARGEIVVGDVDVALDGHFMTAIQVPGDLPSRIYELRLTDDTGLTFSTYVTVEERADDEPVVLRLVAAIAGATVAIGALFWIFRSRPSARPGGTMRS